MLIELKCNNYYSKVFKRVNYKLQNNIFLVVIKDNCTNLKMNFTTAKVKCENFASAKSKCENFASAKSKCENFATPFHLRNFRNSISDLRNLHVIFRYLRIELVRFFLKIFCVITYFLLVISYRYFWDIYDI